METFELSVSFDQIWTCFLGSNVSVFEYVWPACVCFRGFLNCLIHIHSQQVSAETPEEKTAILPGCNDAADVWRDGIRSPHCKLMLGKAWESPFHPMANYIIDIYFFYIYFIYFIYRLSILKDFEPPFERYIIQIHTAYLCIFHFKAKIKCYWS